MVKQYLVWDLPIRIFHWSFVLALLALWYTSDQDRGLIEIHMKLGYVTLGLVLFRLLWGFFGTTHAQFRNFFPSFNQVFLYVQQLKTGKTKKYAGHNPLGSLMVIIMLVTALVQAVCGLFISDDVFSSGPYNGVLDANIESWLKFIHTNGFDVILAFSVMHIFAVLYYLLIKKHNLIKPMVTGKKTSEELNESQSISHSQLVKAIIIAILVAIFIYWLVVVNAPVVEEYYY